MIFGGTGPVSTRVIGACALIVLFVSQAIAFDVSTNARLAGVGGAPEAVYAVGDAFCSRGAREDDGHAPERQGHHAQCCILCGSNDHKTVVEVAAFFSIALRAAPQAPTRALRAVPDDPDRRLIGWASAWSSRAPPSFS